ncbi:hypothetical protein GMMP15_660047 [Candidatus Magnetomoraceae bacterium gMMP-15]
MFVILSWGRSVQFLLVMASFQFIDSEGNTKTLSFSLVNPSPIFPTSIDIFKTDSA